jgi:hypothetical protein
MMAKRKKQQQQTDAQPVAGTPAVTNTPDMSAQETSSPVPERALSRPELPEHAEDQSPLGGGAPRDRIASRAYQLYLERGGGDGRDMDDWLEAERELSDSSRESGE